MIQLRRRRMLLTRKTSRMTWMAASKIRRLPTTMLVFSFLEWQWFWWRKVVDDNKKNHHHYEELMCFLMER